MTVSLQQRYAPEGRCFGCGPANPEGLRIESFAAGDELVCEWMPELHHEAFAGVLNGGIIGALLDCHCNWTAGWHLMRRDSAAGPPLTVTAEYTVKLRRPTPTDRPVRLTAKAASSDGPRVTVEATITADGKVTATFSGRFVAVGPDHPATRHGLGPYSGPPASGRPSAGRQGSTG
ncbi:MAG: PaaI family thioesterase [Thermoanaerobaculia bacterium]